MSKDTQYLPFTFIQTWMPSQKGPYAKKQIPVTSSCGYLFFQILIFLNEKAGGIAVIVYLMVVFDTSSICTSSPETA